MALTKITGQVVDTTTDLVVGVTTVGGGVSAVDGFFSGIVTATGAVAFSTNLTVGGSLSVGGTITYEDVTNVDSVGIITARSNILVGSGITLSPDGDIFFTGIMTGNGSGLTGVANTDVIFPDKISLGDANSDGTDGDQIVVGLGSDLKIFHNGTRSIIKDIGQLRLNGTAIQLRDTSENGYINCTEGGSVDIYYNENKKFETTNTGVTVTGTVAATSYTGDGSSLTGISVGISTASAQVSGITTVIDLDKDDIRLDCTGLVTIDTKGGTEGGNHILRIVNVGLSTVSFSSYFKFPSGGTPALPTASGAISLISFSVHTQGRVGVASVFLAGASVNFS